MKRILVVDHEQDILDTVSDYFSDRYEVTTARTGAAAVEAFRCRRPDVVFLDVNMPGGDGVELLDTLRRLDPMVPIVMVTLVMEVAVAQRCLERGAFAYVPKPFELSYLDRMAALAAGIAGRHN